MPLVRHIRQGKRRGSVLAATLLIGAAAFSLAALCLSAATAMLGEFAALSDALARENAAAEAMEITRAYFLTEIEQKHSQSEASSMLTANPNPVTEVPRSEYAPLAAAYPHALVEGLIIDLHYDRSFSGEAKRLQIAQGSPVAVTTGGGEKYNARRYELRTKVTLGEPPSSHVMKLGVLVLDSGGVTETVDLYTEK